MKTKSIAILWVWTAQAWTDCMCTFPRKNSKRDPINVVFGGQFCTLGPSGLPWVPRVFLRSLWAAFWVPFGCLVGSLGDLGGLLGLPWSSFGLPWVFLGSFRVPFVSLCRPLGLFLDPLGHLWWFLLSQCGRTKENTNEESAYRESRGQTKHKFREAGNYQRP